MTQSGHGRAAFAAMHGPDLLYLIVILGLGVSPHEAARFHYASRQCVSRLAARCAPAAGGDAGDRIPQRRIARGVCALRSPRAVSSSLLVLAERTSTCSPTAAAAA